MRRLIYFFMLMLTFYMGGCDKTIKQQSEFNNLFEAAQHGDVAAIEKLTSTGILIDEVDKYGRTALAYAVMGHHLDAVKFLIAKGAKKEVVTSKGYDLVMLSLYNEVDASLDMLNYLTVDIGLGVNHMTAEGDSALNIAVSSKHEKAVARLISLGALPNQKTIEILENQTQPNAAIVRMIDEAMKRKRLSSKLIDEKLK